MSNLKHTPGPWKNMGLEIRHTERSIILANVYPHLPANQPKTEGEANARLMAAAPDLLLALVHAKSLIEAYSGGKCDFAIITNAINSATS